MPRQLAKWGWLAKWVVTIDSKIHLHPANPNFTSPPTCLAIWSAKQSLRKAQHLALLSGRISSIRRILLIMPPKRVIPVQRQQVQPPASNYFTAAFRELTAPENASVVRSVAMFGVSPRTSSFLAQDAWGFIKHIANVTKSNRGLCYFCQVAGPNSFFLLYNLVN